MKILVVDDDRLKLSDIVSEIGKLGLPKDAIDVVGDVTSAKQRIQETQYDLLILDIALPMRVNESAIKDAGIGLLDEIMQRERYLKPRHVVGITAYAEVYISAAAHFGNELWSVLFYDDKSVEWAQKLRAKIRYLIAASESRTHDEVGQVDICVLTALRDPELNAILSLSWNWKDKPVSADVTQYYEGNFSNSKGERRTVVAASASAMGMPVASAIAAKMIMSFRPRLMVMTGVCAGDSESVSQGDVIVANPSWDYGSGKFCVEEGVARFDPAPQQIGVSSRTRQIVSRAIVDEEKLGKIRDLYPAEKPLTMLKLHLGPLASGAAVLADPARFKEVKNQHRKLLGVDMEAYAVLAAVAEMPQPQPEAIVLKGVQDFADTKKDDKFRHFAAYASAQVFRMLVEEWDL